MPDIGTMHQLNPEPPHIGTMHQLGPEPLHTGEIITPQAQAEEYAREAQESADNAALSAAAAQSAAEIAQQAAESLAPALDEKADAIHTAAGPAPIVSIPDAAAAPVDALTVWIEPVQDLHGYDSPWPAGGGKNKINYLSCVGVGARNGTDSVYGNNTSISGTELTINQAYGANGGILKGVGTFPLATGEYVTISGKATLTGTSVLVVGIANYDGGGTNNINTVVSVVNGKFTVTLNAKSDYAKTGIFLQPQAAGSTAVVSEVMVALGQTEVPYAPYSNICPITGWTGAKVSRTGKNTCSIATLPSAIYWGSDNSDLKAVLNALPVGEYSFYLTYVVDILPGNGKVTHGRPYLTAMVNGSQSPVMSYSVTNDASPSVGKEYRDGGTFTITESIKGNFNHCYLYCDQQDTHNGNERGRYSIKNIQIEVGSTATAYEPYQGSTYDITFPTEAGTDYGGTLAIHQDGTGELVVDRANIASYNGETLPSTWISDRDVYAQGTTPTTGAQVVYKLATPITYQLTNQQVTETLKGTNNIWADTGDVTVGYKADTKLYIDKKFAELQALILEH